MALVTSGKNWKGEPCEFFLDNNLKKNLDTVKEVVLNKDFDYVAIVAGLPGLGKSNFAISCAKYCCPDFDESCIARNAQEFIDISNRAKNRSAIVIDESYKDFNTGVTRSKDYLKIVNHLQIVRQKNLFIFILLPNFFDLSKGTAIYRSHHLFVCYGKKFGDRGPFAAFGREEKKMLYILGQKFMNYQATKPNFRGRFSKQKAIDQDLYEAKKLDHLKEQNVVIEDKTVISKEQRGKLVAYMQYILNVPRETIAEVIGIDKSNLSHLGSKHKREMLEKYGDKDVA